MNICQEILAAFFCLVLAILAIWGLEALSRGLWRWTGRIVPAAPSGQLADALMGGKAIKERNRP
jgi:hypothetical protein